MAIKQVVYEEIEQGQPIEETWKVGDVIKTPWMEGWVADIVTGQNVTYILTEDNKKAIAIPNHRILRIYYGE